MAKTVADLSVGKRVYFGTEATKKIPWILVDKQDDKAVFMCLKDNIGTNKNITDLSKLNSFFDLENPSGILSYFKNDLHNIILGAMLPTIDNIFPAEFEEDLTACKALSKEDSKGSGFRDNADYHARCGINYFDRIYYNYFLTYERVYYNLKNKLKFNDSYNYFKKNTLTAFKGFNKDYVGYKNNYTYVHNHVRKYVSEQFAVQGGAIYVRPSNYYDDGKWSETLPIRLKICDIYTEKYTTEPGDYNLVYLKKIQELEHYALKGSNNSLLAINLPYTGEDVKRLKLDANFSSFFLRNMRYENSNIRIPIPETGLSRYNINTNNKITNFNNKTKFLFCLEIDYKTYVDRYNNLTNIPDEYDDKDVDIENLVFGNLPKTVTQFDTIKISFLEKPKKKYQLQKLNSDNNWTNIVEFNSKELEYYVLDKDGSLLSFRVQNEDGTYSYSNTVTVEGQKQDYVLKAKLSGLYNINVYAKNTSNTGNILLKIDMVNNPFKWQGYVPSRDFNQGANPSAVFNIPNKIIAGLSLGEKLTINFSIEQDGKIIKESVDYVKHKEKDLDIIVSDYLSRRNRPSKILVECVQKPDVILEATNNGLDKNPIYEEIKADVEYVFNNKEKTADRWFIKVRAISKKGVTRNIKISKIKVEWDYESR